MKKNLLLKKMWYYRWIYILMLPGIAYFLTFAYFPMVGTGMAFREFSFLDPFFGGTWVGLNNFRTIFSNPQFIQALFNYDFLISPEGTNLFRFGLEGIDWEMVNGQPASLRTQPLGVDYPMLNDWGWFVTWDQEFQYSDTIGFSPEILEMSNNQLNWWWDNATSIKPYKDFATYTIVHPDGVQFHWDFHEDFIRAMLTGQNAGATWDSILESRMASGYQQFIDTFNEIAISRGILP